MHIGIVGLGRMGANIARRLMRHGHDCVVFDANLDASLALGREGATSSAALQDLVKRLKPPRVVWLMVPAGEPTARAVEELGRLMAQGDTIIDGGNTFWKDDIARAKVLRERGIHYLDVGTSGGVWGLERGYCLMIGGDEAVVDRLDLNLADIAETWRRGSVITSWLLDLTAAALTEEGDLASYSGHVADSGEGRWTVQAAIEEAVPADVLSAALYTRFRSRQEHTFAEKILSAMRKGFGGHQE